LARHRQRPGLGAAVGGWCAIDGIETIIQTIIQTNI
jgi:hypothetical protein